MTYCGGDDLLCCVVNLMDGGCVVRGRVWASVRGEVGISEVVVCVMKFPTRREEKKL